MPNETRVAWGCFIFKALVLIFFSLLEAAEPLGCSFGLPFQPAFGEENRLGSNGPQEERLRFRKHPGPPEPQKCLYYTRCIPGSSLVLWPVDRADLGWMPGLERNHFLSPFA